MMNEIELDLLKVIQKNKNVRMIDSRYKHNAAGLTDVDVLLAYFRFNGKLMKMTLSEVVEMDFNEVQGYYTTKRG